jgi:hypothetical protein
MDSSSLLTALVFLGKLLQERSVTFHVLAIGGGALLLHGLSDRPTQDLDVAMHRGPRGWVRKRPFPAELDRAITDVALALGLSDGSGGTTRWMNDAATGGLHEGIVLPDGWEDRTRRLEFGALTVELLGRGDLVALKLWAATDARSPGRRARDVGDLRALGPTREEFVGGAREPTVRRPTWTEGCSTSRGPSDST